MSTKTMTYNEMYEVADQVDSEMVDRLRWGVVTDVIMKMEDGTCWKGYTIVPDEGAGDSYSEGDDEPQEWVQVKEGKKLVDAWVSVEDPTELNNALCKALLANGCAPIDALRIMGTLRDQKNDSTKPA